MISRDCIITVNGNTATIDSDIYLYKYDKNIQLVFSIINSKYMYDNDDSNNLIKNMQAAYAQVKFKKDDSADIEIEFDIQATREGAVLLTINEELTDEDTELGEYTIQIRLLDSNKNSVVTLPPVESCIHIQAPLFEKLGANTNEVNKAVVNKAVARYAAPLSATVSDGTFNSKAWVDGDKITTAELNRMETGIKTNSTQLKDIAKQVENVGQPTQEQINTAIDKAIEDGKITGSGGINSTAKTLLETILKNAIYTADQSANITSLVSALSSGSTPTITYYTVTNTLTRCTNGNSNSSVAENTSYIATITPNNGYKLDTVTVTMGGTDITSTVYNNGKITINSVTGNIVITATASEKTTIELPQDGLMSEFDFRNAPFESYNLTGWGPVYKTNDKTGKYFIFGDKSYTGDNVGITNYGLREIRAFANESQSLSFGTKFSICLFVRGAQPNILDTGSNSVLAYAFAPQYIDTSNSKVSLPIYTFNYEKSDNTYILATYIVDGNTLKYYFNESLIKTYTDADCTNFSKWKNSGNTINTVYYNGYTVGCAIYNKALTDVEVVDVFDYFKTMEVTK